MKMYAMAPFTDLDEPEDTNVIWMFGTAMHVAVSCTYSLLDEDDMPVKRRSSRKLLHVFAPLHDQGVKSTGDAQIQCIEHAIEGNVDADMKAGGEDASKAYLHCTMNGESAALFQAQASSRAGTLRRTGQNGMTLCMLT
ncbi:hypothetical protein OBBRIDRAFT_473880 [Obba rivulosa]|uniref:Uncharacterized protein n=1 Tax=Obba rivulosa TaxID=1052685 RepID=A0A8E2DEH1_9APHY|nr:hypothetical protein OBBRIDRAFT_473880 [Obba rivulosa]